MLRATPVSRDASVAVIITRVERPTVERPTVEGLTGGRGMVG